MSGPWTRHAPLRRGIAWDLADGHDLGPIRPIAILNHHRDGTSESLSVPYARKELHLVPFNFHAAATSIAPLASLKFLINEFDIYGKVGWHTLDQRYQGLTVRL